MTDLPLPDLPLMGSNDLVRLLGGVLGVALLIVYRYLTDRLSQQEKCEPTPKREE